MVSLWISEALNGVRKMTNELGTSKENFLFAGFCIAILIAASALTAAGAGPDASSQDRASCVGMGHLYRTTPGFNNGQPICQFLDGSWCDAHAFATGQCFPGSYGPYNPYIYNIPQRTLNLADASQICRNTGGRVENVHTPYGDVDLCVFPDGSSVDLRALYYGAYGTYNGALRDDWFHYAYWWLNAP